MWLKSGAHDKEENKTLMLSQGPAMKTPLDLTKELYTFEENGKTRLIFLQENEIYFKNFT